MDHHRATLPGMQVWTRPTAASSAFLQILKASKHLFIEDLILAAVLIEKVLHSKVLARAIPK